MNNQTNYIVFGGSGFVGCHFSKLVYNNKTAEIFNFDIEDTVLNEEQVYEKLDVRESIKPKIYNAKASDIIINLAAVHRTPGHPDDEYFETNIKGAENICNYARVKGINTILFTSSIATYGIYEAQKSESTVPMPNIPYGISKLTAEYIHKLWQQEDPENRRLIILRPGVVFGHKERGNFTRLINATKKNRFFYPGRKDTIKACIYVKDLAQAMVDMLREEPNGVVTYNMTYEPSPRIDKICEVIAEEGKMKKPSIVLPAGLLVAITKFSYGLLSVFGIKLASLHPDRVRKLMISNDINGVSLNNKYKLEYGLRNGIQDWMVEARFFDRNEID